MKFLFAPDSFKGSLTATQIISLLTEEAKMVFPDCEIIKLPMADGGEGTMDILVNSFQGTYKSVTVKNPVFKQIQAKFGMLDNNSAVIEMAAASGLPLLSPDNRNSLKTTTYGTGQLIKEALDMGCRKIIIGIGGSATNDGGIGAMAALGIKFLNMHNEEIIPIGGNLGEISFIDTSHFHPAVKESEFIVMCDVDNPLIGSCGATYVFVPQKGATAEQLDILESGMRKYADLLSSQFHFNPMTKGAGAAGGLGAALQVFTGAKLKSGVSTVMELCRFEELLNGMDLVVTGEGRVDGQSAHGKVLWGVGTCCKKNNIPAVAIAGGMGQGAEVIYEHGIRSIIPTINGIMSIEYAIENAEMLFKDAARRLFQLLSINVQ